VSFATGITDGSSLLPENSRVLRLHHYGAFCGGKSTNRTIIWPNLMLIPQQSISYVHG
jgi:hypothetical protein